MRSARSSTLSGRGLLAFFWIYGGSSCRSRESPAGRFEFNVRRSAGGFEPLPLTGGPDDDHAQASPSNGVPDDIGGEDWSVAKIGSAGRMAGATFGGALG